MVGRTLGKALFGLLSHKEPCSLVEQRAESESPAVPWCLSPFSVRFGSGVGNWAMEDEITFVLGSCAPPESKSLQLVGVLMQNDPFSLSNQLLFTPQLRVLILFVMEVVSEQSSFAWLLMITTCELMNKIQIKNYTGSDSLDVWPQNIEFFFKDLTHTQTYTYVFIHGFFSL